MPCGKSLCAPRKHKCLVEKYIPWLRMRCKGRKGRGRTRRTWFRRRIGFFRGRHRWRCALCVLPSSSEASNERRGWLKDTQAHMQERGKPPTIGKERIHEKTWLSPRRDQDVVGKKNPRRNRRNSRVLDRCSSCKLENLSQHSVVVDSSRITKVDVHATLIETENNNRHFKAKRCLREPYNKSSLR